MSSKARRQKVFDDLFSMIKGLSDGPILTAPDIERVMLTGRFGPEGVRVHEVSVFNFPVHYISWR